MNLLDEVEIIHNVTNHPFRLHEIVKVFRIFEDGMYDVCNKKGDCWRVHGIEIFKIETPMKQMTEAVVNTAKNLCKAQNKVTTLEIKADLIKSYPNYFWTQNYVSAVMDDAQKAGMFTYVDTVTGGNQHRVYSETGVTIKNVKQKAMKKSATPVAVATVVKRRATPKVAVSVAPATKTISKTKALELMENNRGHFFTATFIDKKSQVRTMNCQYLKDQTYSKLGYVKVREAIKAKMNPDDAIRQVNLQTLKELKIAGNSYKVK